MVKIVRAETAGKNVIYAVETDSHTYIADGIYHHNCEHCNNWRDKRDMTSAYAKAVDRLYGKGCADELESLTKEENARRLPPKADLLDIITTCRAYIKRTLEE